METTKSSETVRLTNEELGSLYRRVGEIVRRVEGGNIKFDWAMKDLQRIVEGRDRPEIRYAVTAPPIEFRQPTPNERRNSWGALANRLAHSLQRLSFPQRNPEIIIAELWETECISDRSVNSGATPVHAILGCSAPEARDVQIVNSTIQWLGTHIGQSFLRKFLGVSQVYIS